jgi:transcriptional regulator with XRE-family HTH domain
MSTVRLIATYYFYLYCPDMPALPLTTEQLAEAARLKEIFGAWQKQRKEAGRPASQEDAAELLGFNQSSLSQYLNGRIPLNIDSAVTFARHLDVIVDDFSPIIAGKIRDASRLIAGRGQAPASRPSPAQSPQWISPEAYRLLDLYYGADEDGRKEIIATATEARRENLPTTTGNEA